MSHTPFDVKPSKIEFFSGKQPVKAAHECPENIEYYFSEEELDESLPPRKWIGSGEDGHMFVEHRRG